MVDTRRMSAAVFNNGKFVDVVLVLDSEGPHATAQQIARRAGINHDLAKKVLVRLQDAGLVKGLARVGGSRGALPYEVQPGECWQSLVTLCRALRAAASN